jgi:hypothetical protein
MAFFWKCVDIVPTAGLGLLFLTGWLVLPTPSFDDLIKVDGTLMSYSVEPSDSWAERLAPRPRHPYILFEVSGQPGRFWNDALNPNNVKSIFPRTGVSLTFYIPTHSHFLSINGDARKSYGLTVNGTEIQSIDVSIGGNSFLEEVICPPIGILLLWRAVYLWRKKRA